MSDKSISVQNELKAVPITNLASRETKGQAKLMELLKKHFSEQRPIQRDDIIKLYLDLFYPSRTKTIWHSDYDYVTRSFGHKYRKVVPYDENSYSVRMQSMAWFKHNLGSCIIKGKLLAIPVIEID